MRKTPEIVDADGHLMEDLLRMAEFAPPDLAESIRNPSRNREGVFPSLDGFHSSIPVPRRSERVAASSHRIGSAEDYTAFMEKVGVSEAVLFPTEALSVGLAQSAHSRKLAAAYNDYVAEDYRLRDGRLHPVGIVPAREPLAAAAEIRRIRDELDLAAVMMPSTGLGLHPGHEFFDPIYAAAEETNCPVAFHGGSGGTLEGVRFFSDPIGGHILWHAVPLMVAMVSLAYHGVLERYPGLRVAFLEGGVGWIVPVWERGLRDQEIWDVRGAKVIEECLGNGRFLIGCEGHDASLKFLVEEFGSRAFAYSSDYPHEVDVVLAQEEIEWTLKGSQLSSGDIGSILGGNARAFFGLRMSPEPSP